MEVPTAINPNIGQNLHNISRMTTGLMRRYAQYVMSGAVDLVALE